jgi:hypothetical protein
LMITLAKRPEWTLSKNTEPNQSVAAKGCIRHCCDHGGQVGRSLHERCGHFQESSTCRSKKLAAEAELGY